MRLTSQARCGCNARRAFATGTIVNPLTAESQLFQATGVHIRELPVRIEKLLGAEPLRLGA